MGDSADPVTLAAATVEILPSRAADGAIFRPQGSPNGTLTIGTEVHLENVG